MIKNNALTLIYQGLISLLFFLLVWFTKDQETIVLCLFGTFPGKVIMLLLTLGLYHLFGRLLSTRRMSDVFTSGLALLLVGGLLLILAISREGTNLYNLQPAQDLRSLAFSLMNMPYFTILKMCHIPGNPITTGAAIFFPPALFSISQFFYLKKRRKRSQSRRLR